MTGRVLKARDRFLSVKLLISVILAAHVSAAAAQQDAPPSIKVGETEVTPTIRIDYVTVDNTFRSVVDPVESNGVLVSPTINWVADRRLLKISVGYRGNYGAYDESVLDFNDHSLGISVDARPGTRHRGTLSFSVAREHEELGTGQTRFVANLTDQIESTLVSLRTQYTYGAPNARGNLGGGLVVTSETFDNLAFLTDGDDHTTVRPFALFTYRLSPDTRLVAETRYGIIDYDDDARDRTEISFLTGVNLVATARTGGRVRLGVTETSYDNSSRSDDSVFVAEADLFYSPRSFSRFNLSFDRDLRTFDNDDEGARQTIVDRFGLSWSYQWGARISTVARYSKEIYERECPSNDSDTDTIALQVGVNIRRWITVGVGGSNLQRSVGDCSGTLEPGAADFEVNRIGLFVRATL